MYTKMKKNEDNTLNKQTNFKKLPLYLQEYVALRMTMKVGIIYLRNTGRTFKK